MHAIARSFVLLVAFVTGLASLAAPPVLAQDNGVIIIPVASPVAGETILITNDPTATALDPAMVLALVLVLLLVALFALSEIFRYLRDGREDYYKTFREFAHRGVYVAPVMVNATSTATESRVMDAAGGAETVQIEQVFEMTGPGSLLTGDKATYTARLGVDSAVGTSWQLVDREGNAIPAQNAILEAAPDGASATLTAAKAGKYVVSASPAGNPNLRVRTEVVVVDPQPADGEMPQLPFIGEGYGSIVGAILLLAVIVVLAATRAIDADIIGVLLGSIAGYLFGVGINRNTS
jgi:hypothetical protein